MPENPKIAILTTARSDYGLLKPVIRHAMARFQVDLLIAGSHFLASRGETSHEIRAEFGSNTSLSLVPFDAMDEDATPLGQSRSLAHTHLMVAEWFGTHPYDLLLFLGDRWELWGVTLPAFLRGIPLAHISGGEVTEGVIDDCIRHAHTKIANLHFVATTEYARNVSLMGEEDWRITVVGECGLDLIHNADMATPEEVSAGFGIDILRDYILVTFHPSTLDDQTPVSDQIGILLAALDRFPETCIVFTAPGIEQGSETVITAQRRFVAQHLNATFVDHFGSRNYLSVLKHCKAVVGNSSSGLVEAPSFGVPALNIGNRQKNRLAADSVQHVGYDADAIEVALRRAMCPDFLGYARTCLNPYDPFRDGKNSLRIVNAIERALTVCDRSALRIKKFDREVRADDWNTLLREES